MAGIKSRKYIKKRVLSSFILGKEIIMDKRTCESGLRLLFYGAYLTAFIMIVVSCINPKTFLLKDLVLSVQGREMFMFGFVLAFMLAASITLLLLGLVSGKIHSAFPKRVFYISALFTVTSAVWILVASGAAMRFGLSTYTSGLISHISFILIPLAFAYSLKNRSKQLTTLSAVFTCLFLGSFYFSAGWMIWLRSYPPVLPFVHLSVLGMLFVCTGVSAYTYFVERKRSQLELIIGLAVLTVAVCKAQISYVQDPGTPTSYVFILAFGLLTYVLFLVAGLVRNVVESIEKAKSFEAAASAIPGGVFKAKMDENLTILYANDAFYKLYGLNNEEQAAKAGFTELLHYMTAQEVNSFREDMNAHLQKGELCQKFETHEFDINGQYKWLMSTIAFHPENNELFGSVNDITERRLAEEKLRMKEQEYVHVVNSTGKYIVRYDIADKTLYQESHAAQEFGVPAVIHNVPESFIGMGHVSPEQIEEYRSFYKRIQEGAAHGDTTIRLKSARKHDWAWYYITFAAVCNDAGEASYAVISFEDVTEQREKEIAYEKLQLEYAAVPFDEISVYECNLSRNTVKYVYGGLRRELKKNVVLSFEEQTKLLEKYVLPADRDAYHAFFNRDTLLKAYDVGEINHTFNYRTTHRHNGQTGWQNAAIQLVPYIDVNEVKAFVVVRDISAEKEKERALLKKIEVDALTGVYNRAAIEERIKNALETADQNSMTALIMLDIDKFKGINDTYGHHKGDDILKCVADTLLQVKREYDLVGRLGGDEFVLCLRNIPIGTDLHKRLNTILNSLYFEVIPNCHVSCSFGVALAPEDGKDFETLYKKADAALYTAKKNGRWRYAVYNEDMEDSAAC